MASTLRRRTCTSSCSGSTASPRSCSRRRFALGEILVADRRFLFYALAPILYSAGIILGTVLFGARYGIVATAWGAVAGAAAHLGIRAIGTMRTSFRIRPRLAVRTAAFAEFIRLMVPRMFSVAIEPLTITYFTRVAAGLGRRRRVVAQLRARLPGPAGQPDRRLVLAGGLPTPVGGVRRRRRPDLPVDPRPEPRDDRRPDDGRGRRRCSSCPGRSSRSSSVAGSSARTTSPGRRPSSPRSPCRSRSMRCPTRCRAGCTRRTTRSARSSRRSPGWASSSSPRSS